MCQKFELFYHLIRKIFIGVCRDSGQSLVRGISKNHQDRCSFFRMNVHFVQLPCRNLQTKRNSIEGDAERAKLDDITTAYPIIAPLFRPIMSYSVLSKSFSWKNSKLQ